MTYVNFHTHRVAGNQGDILVENIFPEEYESKGQDLPFISVGIHPWYIKDDGSDQLRLLSDLAKNKNVIALGEAGVDKLKGADMSVQEQVFIKQVVISENFSKPLIIHCVKAYNDIITLRKKMKPKQPWIFHDFASSVQIMNQALASGFYFSFGGALMRNSVKVQKAFEQVPINRLFLETDENTFSIADVYMKAASIKHLEIPLLKKEIRDNLKLLFNI